MSSQLLASLDFNLNARDLPPSYFLLVSPSSLQTSVSSRTPVESFQNETCPLLQSNLIDTVPPLGIATVRVVAAGGAATHSPALVFISSVQTGICSLAAPRDLESSRLRRSFYGKNAELFGPIKRTPCFPSGYKPCGSPASRSSLDFKARDRYILFISCVPLFFT